MAVDGLHLPPLPRPLLFKTHALTGRVHRIHTPTSSEYLQSPRSLETAVTGGYRQTHIPLRRRSRIRIRRNKREKPHFCLQSDHRSDRAGIRHLGRLISLTPRT
jgi:hypothetical protein